MAAMDDLFISKRKVADYIHIAAAAAAVGVCCLIITPFVILFVSFIRDILSEPSLYIQDLYVPSLNKTTTFNTSVFIDLKFERVAASTNSSYSYFHMTLFYGTNRRLPVAHHMIEGFGMDRMKRVDVEAVVEARGLPWEEASRAVSGGSEVAFMVELVVIRGWESCELFGKKCSWTDGQPHVLAAHVAVDGSGHKVSKNPIEFEFIGRLRN